MTKRRKDGLEALPGGPLARRGGWSVAEKDKLLRRRPEIRRYLKIIQRDIVRDICPEGEEHLTAARRLLLDRLMSKLATARLIESYMAERGIVRQDKLEQQNVLEAEPLMSTWLSLNLQIREDLKLIGLDRRPLAAEVLSPMQLLEAAKNEPETQQEGPSDVQDGRTDGAGEGGSEVNTPTPSSPSCGMEDED